MTDIPAIKVIWQKPEPVYPDDPSLPWILDYVISPPHFMRNEVLVEYIGILPNAKETVRVRARSRELLEMYIEMNFLESLPGLINMTITYQDDQP